MALNARFSLIEAEAERQDVQFKMTIQNPKILFGDSKKEAPVNGKRKRSSDEDRPGATSLAGKQKLEAKASPAKKVVLSNRQAVAAANQPGRKTVALKHQQQQVPQKQGPVVVPRGARQGGVLPQQQQQQAGKVRRASEHQHQQQPAKFGNVKPKQQQNQQNQQQANGKKSFKAGSKQVPVKQQPGSKAAAPKKPEASGKGKEKPAAAKATPVLSEEALNAQLDKFMGRDPNQGKREVEAARLDAELEAYARQRAQVAPAQE